MTADETNNIVTSAEEHGIFGDISNEESYFYMICLYICIYTLSTRQCQGYIHRNDIPMFCGRNISCCVGMIYPCCVGVIYPCSVGLIDILCIRVCQGGRFKICLFYYVIKMVLQKNALAV